MTNNNNFQSKKNLGLVLLVLIVAGSLLLSGCAKKPKVYRVGILSGMVWFNASADGFKAKMTELGYIEGENIVYDVATTSMEPDKERDIFEKFVEDEADLIFVAPHESAAIAKEVTQGTDIPVVFSSGLLEGSDLVESIQQPGGNITGVRYPGPEYSARRVEILHEMMPQAKRLWLAYDPNNPSDPASVEAVRRSASSLGMTLIEVHVSNAAEIVADLEEREKSEDIGIDVIMQIPGPILAAPEVVEMLNEFAAKYETPIACPQLVAEVNKWCLFGYTYDLTEAGEAAALLADKILQGTSAGTLPVISPEAHLVINYKLAQELGLTIPEGLLNQADEIIR